MCVAMCDRVDFRTKLCLLKWQRGHHECGAPAEPPAATSSAVQLSTLLEGDPLFGPVIESLLHAWGVARGKLGQRGRETVCIDPRAALELKSKFTKFLCPALQNIARLKVSDDAYAVPYGHLLSPGEVSALQQGGLTLFDLCRSKAFGARVVDASALQKLDDTIISLQHMDPARTRKLVQRYENLPTSDTPHMPQHAASLLNLVALGSPDWDLTTFAGCDALKCGWSPPDVTAFEKGTMFSPLAITLTWLVDKTDDPSVMFFYDSPKNNGGLQSESGNRSGCGVKLLRDACDLVNLATWVQAGSPSEDTPAAREWATTYALTIDDFQRVLAACSTLLKVDPAGTRDAMSIFFPQARNDPVGRALKLGGCHQSHAVSTSAPSWPPGITATPATLSERMQFASEGHCRRILGTTATDKILSRSRQPAMVHNAEECDQSKYTHLSVAHLDDAAVMVNPGELPRLLPPWKNAAIVDPRHESGSRRRRDHYITPRNSSAWRNATGSRPVGRDASPIGGRGAPPSSGRAWTKVPTGRLSAPDRDRRSGARRAQNDDVHITRSSGSTSRDRCDGTGAPN
jgi:hypothetical protein